VAGIGSRCCSPSRTQVGGEHVAVHCARNSAQPREQETMSASSDRERNAGTSVGSGWMLAIQVRSRRRHQRQQCEQARAGRSLAGARGPGQGHLQRPGRSPQAEHVGVSRSRLHRRGAAGAGRIRLERSSARMSRASGRPCHSSRRDRRKTSAREHPRARARQVRRGRPPHQRSARSARL